MSAFGEILARKIGEEAPDTEFEAALGKKLYPNEPMEYDAPGTSAREQGV